MRIVALDLGKSKSAACVFESETGEHVFDAAPTTPETLRLLLEHHQPQRVVIEISPLAGWVGELVVSLGVELQVANPNHEAWRWRNIKRKTDRGRPQAGSALGDEPAAPGAPAGREGA